MVEKQVQKEAQYVVFALSDEEYAIQIDSVQEIVRVPSITPLPGTKKHVIGMTNLRGSIIPILDLGLKC